MFEVQKLINSMRGSLINFWQRLHRRVPAKTFRIFFVIVLLSSAATGAYIMNRKSTANSIGELAYIQTDGMFVMEAEHYYQNIANDGQLWTESSVPVDPSGGLSMKSGTGKYAGDLIGHAPELGYYLNIETPGTYYIYMRVAGPNPGNGGPTCWFGLNNTIPPDNEFLRPATTPWEELVWSKNDIVIPTKGVAMLNIWQRTADFQIDKIIVTQNPSYLAVGSTDLGPAESPTASLSTLNRPPVAAATASAILGDSPLTVNFTNTSSDPNGNETIASYAWDFGDGTTSVEASPSHAFTNDGDTYQKNFTVSLTVTDTDGAVGIMTMTITANKVMTFGEYFTDSKGLINSAGIHIYPIPEAVTSGTLEYRVDGSSTWHDTLPPVITVANGRLESGVCEDPECGDMLASNVEPMIRRFIGGVTGLSPSTTYDFRATLLKADGSTYDTKILQVTTMPDKVAYGTGRTINIKADGTGDYASIQLAINAALPGDTIILQPGDYTWGFSFTNKNGTKGNPITLRGLAGAVFHDTVGGEARLNDNSHDIILEGLNVNSAPIDITKYSTLSLWTGVTRVTIQNSTLHNTRIYSTRSAEDLIIQNNEITWDRYAIYTMYIAGGPYRGLIYRNNYLRATGDSYDVSDFRGKKQFAEIYNNYFEGIHGDDGMEMEGSSNVLVFVHDNIMKFRKTSSTHGGKGNTASISNTPIMVGPVYFFRNNIDAAHEFIKFANDSSTQLAAKYPTTLANYGPLFYFNNTFYANSAYWGGCCTFIRNMGQLQHANLILKNNIFYGKVLDKLSVEGAYASKYTPADRTWGMLTSDYNLFFQTGVTTNPYASYPVDQHSVFADPSFVAPDAVDLHLNASSPAIDKATFIPGVTDTFSGSAPDMGAFEFGSTTGGNHPPILDPIPNKTAQTGQALTFTLSAHDIDAEDTVTYSSGNLPTGANLDASTGAFSWTPTESQIGVYNINFKATDKNLAFDTETAKITVTAPNSPPVLTEIPNQTIETKKLLSFVLSASDPDSDDTITFSTMSLTGNGLPPGATLDSITGAFNWQPAANQKGNYSITFRATDKYGAFAEIIVNITVSHINQPPTVKIAASTTLGDEPLTVDFTSTGTDLDGKIDSYSWNFGDGGSAVTANVSHTFVVAGNYTVGLTVIDNSGETAVDTVKIKVNKKGNQGIGHITIGSDADGVLPKPAMLKNGSGKLIVRYKLKSDDPSYFKKLATNIETLQYQQDGGGWKNLEIAYLEEPNPVSDIKGDYSGDFSNLVVLSKKLLPEVFLKSIKIRFSLRLGDAVSNVVETPDTKLDNKTPKVKSVAVKSSVQDGKIKLDFSFDVEDDSPIEYILSQNADFSDGSWQPYLTETSIILGKSTKQNLWTKILAKKALAADQSQTVTYYIRFRDENGNQSATYTETVALNSTGTTFGQASEVMQSAPSADETPPALGKDSSLTQTRKLLLNFSEIFSKKSGSSTLMDRIASNRLVQLGLMILLALNLLIALIIAIILFFGNSTRLNSRTLLIRVIISVVLLLASIVFMMFYRDLWLLLLTLATLVVEIEIVAERHRDKRFLAAH